MSGITPRPYQLEAKAALNSAMERGVKAGMVALPTGTGKTVIFADWIKESGGTALILAHREELLGQAERKIAEVAPELAMSMGVVKAGRNDVNSPIVLASVQTLASKKRLHQLPRKFDRVVVDEAHHATAPTYRAILDYVEADMVGGFTATPERHDDSSLKEVFEEIVYARSILQMIQEGYLANLTGKRVELTDLDLSSVKVTRGEYQAEDLGRAMREAEAPEHTAAALMEHAPERKSIVFVPTVALAIETAAAICAVGIAAGYVHGKQPKDERREVLRKLTSGDLQAVVNVDVLTEGFDEPSVDCIAIAAPTKSRIAYVQRVGRGTRLYPNKEDCLILDLVGVTDDLSLQSLPDLFDLEQAPRPDETVTEAVQREAEEKAKSAEEKEQIEADAAKRKARDATLFGRDRLHWLDVDGRWVLSAGGGDHLVLDPIGEDAFQVLLLKNDRARILARNLDLGYAQGAAEEAIRRRGAMGLADKEAKWRKGDPSDGQLGYIRKLGVEVYPQTKGEAADLIDMEIARGRLEKLDGALAVMTRDRRVCPKCGELSKEATRDGVCGFCREEDGVAA